MTLRTLFWSLGSTVWLALLGCDASQTGDGNMGAGGSAPVAGSAPQGGSPQAGSGQGGSAQAGMGGVSKSVGGYEVVGNKFVDANGNEHRFHGISRPSLEWAVDGEVVTARDWDLMKSWGANLVRLPLNQVFWRTVPRYKLRVQSMANEIIERGMDVIIDLHWSEGPTPGTGAQQEMADSGSLQFWTEAANMFKGEQRVLFELYNEPKLVSQGGNAWNIWLNGGQVGGFTAVGMLQLYNAVRATGARNIIILGGIDFGYDLKGAPMYSIPNAVNIAYSSHPYDFNNKMQGSWETDWGFVSRSYPIILTEFGRHPGSATPCDPTYPKAVIDYANSKGISWVAWAWYVKDCTFPSLITDYVQATPTATGAMVKQALSAFVGAP